ncbi:MAG: PAS domain S-box protein [Thiotrichaceae bacterium]|nr:PAS domain S-box protein [Thiotrichaceae bacterium]
METEQRAGELPLATLPYASLCFVNFQGKLLEKTPSCAPFLGLSTGDLSKIIFAEDWEIFSQQLQAITQAAAGYSTQFEIRCCNQQGNFAMLLWQATRTTTGFYAQLTDISAYSHPIHNNLRGFNEENHYHELLFEQNLLGIFRSTPEGQVLKVNNALAMIYGYESVGEFQAEVVSIQRQLYVYPEQRRHILETMRNSNGIMQLFEVEHYHRSGRIIFINMYLRAYLDTQHNIQYLEGILQDISDYKHLETELRHSEANYRLLAEHSTDMISRHTLQGIYRYVSPACSYLLGYAPSELIDRSVYQLVHADDLAQVTAAYRPQPENSRLTFTYRMRHKNGAYLWFETTNRILPADFSSSLPEVLSVSREISQRKRIEQESHAAHERLLRVLDSLDALVYVADLESYEILYVNKYGRDAFGEIVGEVCWKVFWKDGTAPCYNAKHPLRKFCNQLRAHAEMKASTSQVHESFNNITQKWYSIHSRAIYWVDQRLVRLEIAYDITARKQQERALKQSQERYSLATHAGKTGVWDWNISTQYFYIDGSIKQLLGYKENELQDNLSTWLSLVHPDDVDFLKQAFKQYLSGNSAAYQVEHRMIHRDGQVLWMLERGEALQDAAGKAYRVIGTSSDITEHKLSKQQLQRQEQFLRKIAQITHLLLTVPSYDQAITQALDALGSSLEVDRAYLIENEYLPKQQDVLMFQRCAWIKASQTSDNPRHFHQLSYVHHLPEWYQKLLENQSVLVNIHAENSEFIQLFLEQQQISSLLIIPIHFKGHFWGCIILEMAEQQREWTTHEIFSLGLVGDSMRGALLRQQIKNSLQRSEAKFRTIIENNHDAILIIDPNDLICFANPAAEQLYQVANDELTGTHCPFAHAENAHQEQAVIDREGELHICEMQLTELIWENLSVTMVTLRDITARKQAEDALRQSEQRLQTLTNNLPIVLFALDSDGVFTVLRGKGLEALGLSEESLLGKSIFEQYRHFPDVIENTRRALQGETFSCTISFNKGRLILEIQYSPLLNQAGKLIGTLVLATNITERKRVEIELHRAKEAAEIANRSKSEFLAAMSHEIRTPMNGVIGVTQLLTQTELSPQQAHYVEMIHTSGETLLTVINDILDFSKIEAGKLVLDNIEFDLRALFEDVISFFAPAAQRKGLNIICDLPPQLPQRMCGDVNRLRQILNNLIGNAVKFTQRGEVCLEVTVAEERETQIGFAIAVSDTGIGISAQLRANLFKPFSQASSEISRQYGGTGLGLVISKRLIEMMGGNIGVHSVPNQGSTFWLKLPLDKTDTAPFCSLPSTSLLHGMRALIIDSYPKNTAILKRELQAWEMPVSVLDRAEAVHALLQQVNFMPEQQADVILLDSHVPRLNYTQVLQQFNSHPWLRSVPIIMLTSLQQYVDAPQLECVTSYLNKPIRQSELRHALLQVRHPVSSAASPQRLQKAIFAKLGDFQILLVEDNLINQEIARDMLLQLGCMVFIAKDGLEAVHAVQNAHFDLILMDCHMPNLDGFAASQQIRQFETKHQRVPVPIVALTANAMQGDKERCLSAGMNDFVTKPIILAKLRPVLERWLRPEQAHYQPSPATVTPETESGEVLDKSLLANLRADSQMGSINWLIDLYLQELPNYLESLQQAGRSGDTRNLYLQAHKLKGASANLGAKRLVVYCRSLEDVAQQSKLEPIEGLMQRIMKEAELLKKLLLLEKQQERK